MLLKLIKSCCQTENDDRTYEINLGNSNRQHGSLNSSKEGNVSSSQSLGGASNGEENINNDDLNEKINNYGTLTFNCLNKKINYGTLTLYDKSKSNLQDESISNLQQCHSPTLTLTKKQRLLNYNAKMYGMTEQPYIEKTLQNTRKKEESADSKTIFRAYEDGAYLRSRS